MKLKPEDTMNKIMARLSPTKTWLKNPAKVMFSSMGSSGT
jgi:hypothetical protein